MNLFRTAIACVLLALLGALMAQLLLQEPGYVLVRYRGYDISTTVAAGIGLLLAGLAVLAVAGALLALPIQLVRRYRQQQHHPHVSEALAALRAGDLPRAEQLLQQASDAQAGLGATLIKSALPAAQGCDARESSTQVTDSA